MPSSGPPPDCTPTGPISCNRIQAHDLPGLNPALPEDPGTSLFICHPLYIHGCLLSCLCGWVSLQPWSETRLVGLGDSLVKLVMSVAWYCGEHRLVRGTRFCVLLAQLRSPWASASAVAQGLDVWVLLASQGTWVGISVSSASLIVRR